MLCIDTLPLKKEDGTLRGEWLFTGSDDNTIRIWDLKSGACLEELIGHTNGVLTMTFAANSLYTGSYDKHIY